LIFDPWPKETKEDLFDFDEEVNTIIKALRDPSVRLIIIKGLRRTGKSSILRVALNLAKYNYILLDMREFAEIDRETFTRAFSKALLDMLREKSKRRKIMEHIRAVTFMGMRIDLSEVKDEIDYRTLLREINSWAKKKNTFFVLAIDEAQEVAKINFDKYLAFVYDNLTRIKIILARSQVGVISKILEDPRKPLFGRARVEINTRRLTREQAIGFLTQGFEEAGIRIDQNILSRIVNKLDGVIGWLTLFGWYVVQGKDPDEALNLVLSNGIKLVKNELDLFLETRGTGIRRYILVLKILAEGPKRWKEVKEIMEIKLRRRIANNQITRYLTELIKYGFIEKRENLYYIPDPLLRETIMKEY